MCSGMGASTWRCLQYFLLGPYLRIKADMSARERRTLQKSRIGAILVFFLMFLWVILVHDTNKQTAPVAGELRSKVFSDDEENLGQIMEQKWVEKMGLFMPGPDIASLLSNLQLICSTESLLEDAMTDMYDCDIVRIDFEGTHINRKHPLIPCANFDKTMAMFEKGDKEPFGDIPTILKDIYDRNGIPEGERASEEYRINAKWKMFNNFFNQDADLDKGKLGPLPMLNQKLNVIGKALKDHSQSILTADTTGKLRRGLQSKKRDPVWNIFNDDSRQFVQSCDATRRPEGENLKPVEMNHHWDTLFRCDPEQVDVKYELKTIMDSFDRPVDSRPPVRLWWRVHLSFTRTERGLNMYKSHLSLETGPVHVDHRSVAILIPIFCLLFFTHHILTYVAAVIVFFPWNLYKLFAKKQRFRAVVGSFLDPLDKRTHYVPWASIWLENIAGTMSLVGIIWSLHSLLGHSSETAVYIGFEKIVSPFRHWKDHVGLTQGECFSELMFSLWRWSAFHGASTLFYFFRLLEFSTLFSGTTFLISTLVLAVFPLFYFCLIFISFLFVYATFLHITFGAEYTQFASLSRSFEVISLYSFSFGDYWNQKVFPFVESEATFLLCTVLSFQVIVVTILLNMFTTIVLSAYSQAKANNEDGEGVVETTKLYFWTRAKILFGYTEELEEELAEMPAAVKLGLMNELIGNDFVPPLDSAREAKADSNGHKSMLSRVKKMRDDLDDMADRLQTFVEAEERMMGTVVASQSHTLLGTMQSQTLLGTMQSLSAQDMMNVSKRL